MTDVVEDTVTITVDGRAVEAKAGEMLIAAAERAGTYIPRFCYHPRMRPVGMCRMCLVEVNGPRGPQLVPSCFVPVAEGQEVITDSERVKKAQDGVLEFLLINHPLDCPVCDKGGECPLQDQTLAFGPGETRFVEEKRHWEKPIALSDLVLLDRERCIQCDRCTRFADEIAGDRLIEFIGRGDRTEVNTFPDTPFASYFSGNTVQICPVGALTSVPYRFRARPWDLEQVESTCTSCAFGCRVALQSSSDRITRLLGLDVDPVNHGWLCDKGRFDHESANARDRLTTPLVRRGDQLAEASWGEALAAAATALADAKKLHGSSGIGVIGGSRLANEDAYAWAKLAKGVIGTDSVDCQIGDGLPAEVVLGLPRATIDDACSASTLIYIGPDPKEELPVLFLRLRGAIADGKGPALIELTPKGTSLSRFATVRLHHRPGEGGALARALVSRVIGDAAGVEAGAIDAARRLLEGRSGDGIVVVLGRPSLAEPASSVADAALALAQALPGATFLSALRRANVHGALDMGLAPGLLPGRVTLDVGRAWFDAAWPTTPEARGAGTEEMLSAAADGKLAALVLLGADPMADFPDRDLAERGVRGAGTVIAIDTFRTPSVERADIVLPAAMWGERGGTTTNIEGRISRLGHKITAPGLAWPDWMIAVELAFRLGADLGFDEIDEISDEIERLAPSHVGITTARLLERAGRDGIVAPLAADVAAPAVSPDPVDDAAVVAVGTQGVGDVTGSSPPSDPEPSAEPEFPVVAGPSRPDTLRFTSEGLGFSAPPLDGYALRLVVSRVLYDTGTLVQRAPALARLAAASTVRVNPYDLDRLGIASGGRVRMRTANTALDLEVAADESVPRGSAWLPWNAIDDAAGSVLGPGVTDVRLETP
ncbi:MAG TPA: NADH-quinone oxidoreductase subunit NuoG [Acidimicrobiales bacterium]|nr:NADH-quinone oxidoreductase subunit NuoG [Acidimicrobiales bacterium]